MRHTRVGRRLVLGVSVGLVLTGLAGRRIEIAPAARVQVAGAPACRGSHND